MITLRFGNGRATRVTVDLPLDRQCFLTYREIIRDGWAAYDRAHPEWAGFSVQPNDIVRRILEPFGMHLLTGADEMYQLSALLGSVELLEENGTWSRLGPTIPETHGGPIR